MVWVDLWGLSTYLLEEFGDFKIQDWCTIEISACENPLGATRNLIRTPDPTELDPPSSPPASLKPMVTVLLCGSAVGSWYLCNNKK